MDNFDKYLILRLPEIGKYIEGIIEISNKFKSKFKYGKTF